HGLQALPTAPLPGGEAAHRRGEHLGAAPRRELAAGELPGAAQPVVAACAAQRTVFPRQTQAALERQRATVREEGSEALAQPLEILCPDLSARDALRALELLLQARAVVRVAGSGRSEGQHDRFEIQPGHSPSSWQRHRRCLTPPRGMRGAPVYDLSKRSYRRLSCSSPTK